MNLILLQDLTETALEINPWNALGYGALVLSLGFAVIYLWRQYLKETQYSREMAGKVIELVTKVGAGYESDQKLKDDFLTLGNDMKLMMEKMNDLSTLLKELERNKRD